MTSKIHEPHPDCPDNLDCLPDTDERPQHTLPVILRCAILGSPRKRLTIREIYGAMEGKYPYYRTAGPTWKQSVRHHLSLNRLFERQPRPVADPGFGSYWTVNLTAPPGTKRPRKRGRPNKDQHDVSTAPLTKRRGRPRKKLREEDEAASFAASGSYETRRPILSNDSALYNYDDVEGGLLTQDEGDEEDERVSEEEECESEEENVVVCQPGPDLSRRNGPVPPHLYIGEETNAKPRIYFPGGGDKSYHLIDHLKIEMAGLRRQSAEASLRMSDQLAEAQAAASRARAALKAAERMLEDEARKRRDAEREADEEARRRRAAEEKLESLRNQV